MRLNYALLVFLVVLAGCGSTKEKLTGCDHYSGWCNEIRELAAQSWKYGQLSKNVYEQEFQFDLSSFYERIADFEKEEIDFYSSLYRDRASEEYILVFRGTDSPLDWKTGNNPYKQQQNLYALEIFDEIKERYGLEEMTVVGHSLGGGIAIHISLNRKGATAYSFNGSPVFRNQGNEENKRYSIVENGEILKLLRIPGREATQLYTSIGCSGGNPLSQHDMESLAVCLTQIAAIESDDAKRSLDGNNIKFLYPKE